MILKFSYRRFAWILFFSSFFLLMLQITLRYIPFSSDVSFLQIKQTEVLEVKPYLTIFYIHVYTAIFTLLAGFTQFNNYLLKNYKITHRIIGYIYFVTVVFLAAPSGIYIGYYANGGIFSQISFILLGIFWIFFTIKAIYFVKKGNFKKHKEFMLRSFALTFSAITLRLWKVIIVFLFHPAPMDVYQITAWLGWIPNIIFVEYLIQLKNEKNHLF